METAMTSAQVTPIDLDNSFARELAELYVDSQPTPVPAPELVAFNGELAAELGLDSTALSSPDGIAMLAGNLVPTGVSPIAMAYAGHQFGSYSPSLGDGRALLLGEIVDPDGHRLDLHLKGSGRTSFARGGDGKPALGPMLREFLIAEAMYALGIPTTRALAVVTTGEHIAREQPVPGAILARVASSHLRVGTFEYAARLGDPTVLQRLADYTIDRHYGSVADSDDRYLAFLEEVIEVQAELVARWMLVGFIHGVMNTDNMAISGQGIDYGPCAFMDRYDPATVFSSIDHAGRYAYGNQPMIAQWNLARLAETLIPLINPDRDTAIAAVTEKLEAFTDRYRQHWAAGMTAKLGLTGVIDNNEPILDSFLDLLQAQRVDYTTSFRALADYLRGNEEALTSLFDDRAQLEEWTSAWQAHLVDDGIDHEVAADAMDRLNPIYVPRNHLVEQALAAAETDDLEPFRELLDVVTHPFKERDGLERFAEPAPVDFDSSYQTFCGT